MSGSKPGQSFEPFYPSAIKKRLVGCCPPGGQPSRWPGLWLCGHPGGLAIWVSWRTGIIEAQVCECNTLMKSGGLGGSETCNTGKNTLNHIVHIDWNWLEFPLGSIKDLSIYLVKIRQ